MLSRLSSDSETWRSSADTPLATTDVVGDTDATVPLWNETLNV